MAPNIFPKPPITALLKPLRPITAPTVVYTPYTGPISIPAKPAIPEAMAQERPVVNPTSMPQALAAIGSMVAARMAVPWLVLFMKKLNRIIKITEAMIQSAASVCTLRLRIFMFLIDVTGGKYLMSDPKSTMEPFWII